MSVKVGLIVGHSENKKGAYNEKFNLSEFTFNSILAKTVAYYLNNPIYHLGCNYHIGRIINKDDKYYAVTPDGCEEVCDKKTDKKLINAQVIYRDSYVTLPSKVNKTNVDFAISFHCNAFNKKVSGTEVLYYYKSKKGRQIAQILQDFILSSFPKFRNRGVISILKNDRGGYLLAKTKMPCVILEPFFIDNDNDLEFVLNNFYLLVGAITTSIEEICRTIYDK